MERDERKESIEATVQFIGISVGLRVLHYITRFDYSIPLCLIDRLNINSLSIIVVIAIKFRGQLS